MGSRRSPSAPEWQVILEEIRSQNRSTLEAVEAFRESVEGRIEQLDRDSRGRDEVLALAITDLRNEVRQHGSDLTELKRLSLHQGADILELKALGQQHQGHIAELKTLGRQHQGDIAELKTLGQQHGAEIRELKLTVQESTLELRSLSQKVDALNRLEERVAALERRAEQPGGATPPPV